MRTLLSLILVTALALPVPAFAQATSSNPATDPDGKMFPDISDMRGQVNQNTAVTIPPYNDDGTEKSAGNDDGNGATTTQQTLYSIGDAKRDIDRDTKAGLPFANACNPVIWARLKQQQQFQALQQTAAAMAMNNQATNAVGKGSCVQTAAGNTRQTVLQQVQNKLQSSLTNAVCSLNWSSLLGFSFNASLNICQNGQIFGVSGNGQANSQLSIGGQDASKKNTGCVTGGSVSTTTMQNVVNITQQIKPVTTQQVSSNGGNTVGNFKTTSVPVPTSGCSGFSFGLGNGFGLPGNSGSSCGIAGLLSNAANGGSSGGSHTTGGGTTGNSGNGTSSGAGGSTISHTGGPIISSGSSSGNQTHPLPPSSGSSNGGGGGHLNPYQ